MQEADRDHLIEALDGEIANLEDEKRALELSIDSKLDEVTAIDESIAHLWKQRREVLA